MITKERCKSIAVLFFLCYTFFFQCVTAEGGSLSIVPKPQSVELHSGAFTITDGIIVAYNTGSPELQSLAQLVSDRLRLVTGYPVPVQSTTDPSLRQSLSVAEVSLQNFSSSGFFRSRASISFAMLRVMRRIPEEGMEK